MRKARGTGDATNRPSSVSKLGMTGIRSLNAAPFLALFAILMVIVLLPASPSRGEAVQIVHFVPCDSLAARSIVATVIDARNVMLNQITIDTAELPEWLDRIYRTRAERILLINAAPELPFQLVAQVIDVAKQQVEVVAFVTPRDRNDYRCSCVNQPSPQEWESTGRRPL